MLNILECIIRSASLRFKVEVKQFHQNKKSRSKQSGKSKQKQKYMRRFPSSLMNKKSVLMNKKRVREDRGRLALK